MAAEMSCELIIESAACAAGDSNDDAHVWAHRAITPATSGAKEAPPEDIAGRRVWGPAGACASRAEEGWSAV